MANGGYVGGDPVAMRAACADIARAAEQVASVLAAFAGATSGAAEAAGDGSAIVALARCRAAWGDGLDQLTGQLRALGVVVGAGAADLDAASGS